MQPRRPEVLRITNTRHGPAVGRDGFQRVAARNSAVGLLFSLPLLTHIRVKPA